MGLADRQYAHPWGCTCPKCEDERRRYQEIEERERDRDEALRMAAADLKKSKGKKDVYEEHEDLEGRIWCSNCEKYVRSIDIRDKLNHSIRYVCIPCGKTLREIKVTGEQDQKRDKIDTDKSNPPKRAQEEHKLVEERKHRQQEEEEKRRWQSMDWAKQQEARTNRRRKGLCEICGTPLGLLDKKFAGQTKCKKCRQSDVPPKNSYTLR